MNSSFRVLLPPLTPHLLLLRDFAVLNAQRNAPCVRVVVDVYEWRHRELELACCFVSMAPPKVASILCVHVPSGPCTDIVLRGILRYVVGSFFTTGSPMSSSTPGGIEMGVRPSLEFCADVAEKARVHCWAAAAVAGRAMRRAVVVLVAEAAAAVTEHSAALASACPRLGANIVVCVCVSSYRRQISSSLVTRRRRLRRLCLRRRSRGAVRQTRKRSSQKKLAANWNSAAAHFSGSRFCS